MALSGGPDSVALLLLVWAHWPERRSELLALHFDHRLRGAASARDAKFCLDVCRGLGVKLVSGAWRRAQPGAVSEAAAREARMAFIEAACRRHRVRAVFFGHQQDDVAETMLMRLARGSGTAGLAAPRPLSEWPIVRLRPLLGWKKAEIAEALRVCGISWRVDSTNAGEGYFRNRIRGKVVEPWIEASGRDALAGAAWARELLQEDDEALEAWTDRARAITPGGWLRLKALAGCPRAVWRRALHRWLQVQRGKVGALSRAGFASLLVSVEEGRPARHSLGPKAFGVVRGGYLRLEVPRRGSR